jgi:UDP-glucuronate decarboxylase
LTEGTLLTFIYSVNPVNLVNHVNLVSFSKMSKKILITGGAGFIGSHLARRLLARGDEVTVMDNLFTGTRENIYDLQDKHRFSFVLHDVTQPFWGQFDEIYNLACPASPIHYQRNPVETLKTSFLGMMNVLELALKTKARVFHTSTSEIYGDPEIHPQPESYWGHVNTIGIRSCYDEGKRAAETLCADYAREYGVDVRMIRIFNTYGPYMHPQDGRVISNFIMQALRGKDITLYGEGEQTRSFQYVDDLVQAMVTFMELSPEIIQPFFAKQGMTVPVINVGNPGEYTIRQLAEEIVKLIPGCPSKCVYLPLPKDDPRRRKPDITLATELLRWQPLVSLQEGLSKTIAYFSQRV